MKSMVRSSLGMIVNVDDHECARKHEGINKVARNRMLTSERPEFVSQSPLLQRRTRFFEDPGLGSGPSGAKIKFGGRKRRRRDCGKEALFASLALAQIKLSENIMQPLVSASRRYQNQSHLNDV
jgi:hypothetical protein